LKDEESKQVKIERLHTFETEEIGQEDEPTQQLLTEESKDPAP